jgi:hypothetical protein
MQVQAVVVVAPSVADVLALLDDGEIEVGFAETGSSGETCGAGADD